MGFSVIEGTRWYFVIAKINPIIEEHTCSRVRAFTVKLISHRIYSENASETLKNLYFLVSQHSLGNATVFVLCADI